MADKIRADVALVQQQLCESRERAQTAIMEGRVFSGEKRINKASETVDPNIQLTLRASGNEYVSRGALKLEKAVHVFGAKLNDQIVMDIGASTGGFTDVCLKNNAKRVYSIDVGYGQLDWKLRNDPRVTVMERTNARYLTSDSFDEKPTITVMDVSFISIRLILPVAIQIMGDEGVIYTLIKPQFEAGRGKVGKNGVVRDPAIHEEVLNGIICFAQQLGWPIRKIDYSPITGPKGNIEFIAEMRKEEDGIPVISSEQVKDLVKEAHLKMDHQV
jgi:23S rRNA (cytidine1920-2'-O)/16S rRNA (cytidine1409-2'-O)-methyltransferase